MQDILITGAAGFIGYHLAKRLTEEGNYVVGLDNFDHNCGASLSNCIQGDITDTELVSDLVQGVDEVFHLAAQIHVDRSREDPELTKRVNVQGTRNILEACAKYNKKLIFAGSAEIYGTAQADAILEDHILNPQSPYAQSKLDAEKLCIEYARSGLDVKILRNFNTFGPYQNNGHYGSVIPIFVKRILSGNSPQIFGNGTQSRDFMYITDAIEAYKLASERAPSGVPLNFGSGSSISVNDLAALILKITGSKTSPEHTAPRPDEVMRLRADISRSRNLGFEPKTSLAAGLSSYIGWFEKERHVSPLS